MKRNKPHLLKLFFDRRHAALTRSRHRSRAHLDLLRLLLRHRTDSFPARKDPQESGPPGSTGRNERTGAARATREAPASSCSRKEKLP